METHATDTLSQPQLPMANSQEGQQNPEVGARLLDGTDPLDLQQQKIQEILKLQRELEKQWMMQRQKKSGEEAKSLEIPSSAAGDEATSSDSECFATGEQPADHPQQEAPQGATPSAMRPSSAILWAMPLCPPSPPLEDSRQSQKQSKGLPEAGATIPSNSQQDEQQQQHAKRQRVEREQDEKTEAASLAGFLQQFQEVLPPQTAADCVVCALQPIRPAGCGDTCSCCSAAKKAAVQRLRHQFAVVLPSSAVNAEELLHQTVEHQQLAKRLTASCGAADRCQQRLVFAEQEKQDLQQKMQEVLQQQQTLHKEVATTSSQFRAQQEAWERKDRLQQDQILYLSAKLKAYTEELEALRRLRALDAPGSQQQQPLGRGLKLHFSPEPRACTDFNPVMKEQGTTGSAKAASRPRSKTEYETPILVFRGDDGARHNAWMSSEDSEEPRHWQQHMPQKEQQESHERLEALRQKRRQLDTRQRAQTTNIPQRLLQALEPLAREGIFLEQTISVGVPTDTCGNTAEWPQRRAKSCRPGCLLQKKTVSPFAANGEAESPRVVFPLHAVGGDSSQRQEQPLRTWQQDFGERDVMLLGEEEKDDSSLSSLRLDWEKSEEGTPQESPCSPGQRMQFCFFPAALGHSPKGNETKPQLRNATELPQSLTLQLKSIRQQLLSRSAGLAQQQRERQRPPTKPTKPEKPAAAAAASAANEQQKLDQEARRPQLKQREALAPRAARAISTKLAAGPSTCPQPSSRERNLTTLQVQRQGGPAAVAGALPTANPPHKASPQALASNFKDHKVATQQHQPQQPQHQQQQPQQQQGKGPLSFQCNGFCSECCKEETGYELKESPVQQEEQKKTDSEEEDEDSRKPKVVRWKGRSLSCSFASERTVSRRLLYLTPRGETVHPKKLEKMLQENVLLKEDLQLESQLGVASATPAEKKEQQQSSAPSSAAESPAQAAAGQGAPAEMGANGKLPEAKSDAEEKRLAENKAAAKTTPSHAAQDSRPQTPTFPQAAETDNASLHAQGACGEQQQMQQQQNQPPNLEPDQQRPPLPQPAETSQLKTPAVQPSLPLLHMPLAFSQQPQLQQQAQQMQQHVQQMQQQQIQQQQIRQQQIQQQQIQQQQIQQQQIQQQQIQQQQIQQQQIQQQQIQQQQIQQQHMQQQQLPWLAASHGLTGGLLPPSSQNQASPQGYASFPVAVQPAAPLSPRPVFFLYASSCLQQQQQQQQQQQRQQQEQQEQQEPKQRQVLSGSCRPMSCCQNNGSRTPCEGASIPASLSLCSNNAACYCEPCKCALVGAPVEGLVSEELPARSSERQGEHTSGSCCTDEGWCLCCKSGAQLSHLEGETDAASLASGDAQQVEAPFGLKNNRKEDIRTLKETAGQGVPSTPRAAAAAQIKEQQSQRQETPKLPAATPRKLLLVPQPAASPELSASPNRNEHAQSPSEEAPGESACTAATTKGSPKARSKTTSCFHPQPRQPTPHGQLRNTKTPLKPLPQQPSTEEATSAMHTKLEQQQQRNVQKRPQQQQQRYPPAVEPAALAAAVATQTSLLFAQKDAARVTPAGLNRFRGPAKALHSQPVSHLEGVDYLNPAVGDTASVSSLSSFGSLKADHSAVLPHSLQQRALSACPASRPSGQQLHPLGACLRPHKNKALTPNHIPTGKPVQCRTQPEPKAAGAADSQPETTPLAQGTHEQLERQIRQLQQWQTQLHLQQHLQHHRLMQQQRMFQQQQRLFQQQQQQQHQQQQERSRKLEWSSRSHQRSVTPQLQQHHHLQVAALPFSCAEMGTPSAGLVYVQVQESPRWRSRGPVQQQQSPRFRLPAPAATATTPAAIHTETKMEACFFEALTPSTLVLNRDSPLTAAAAGNDLLSTPILTMQTPTSCMLLPMPHPTTAPATRYSAPLPPYATPRTQASRPPTAMLF